GLLENERERKNVRVSIPVLVLEREAAEDADDDRQDLRWEPREVQDRHLNASISSEQLRKDILERNAWLLRVREEELVSRVLEAGLHSGDEVRQLPVPLPLLLRAGLCAGNHLRIEILHALEKCREREVNGRVHARRTFGKACRLAGGDPQVLYDA